MPSYSIPNPETLQREIQGSHKRCRKYGVDAETIRNPLQKKLTPAELRDRLQKNKDFLNIAIAQIEELYQFVAGAGFVVNIADSDGYILHVIGDAPLVDYLAANNCSPGYRWTEKDVGTSVISLSLARQIPVQINDEEHFCKRGHGHTCSASPVFDDGNNLLGVIAMSGDAAQVHPHTLGMVITAARAIGNQLRIMKTSKELLLRNNYMNAMLESIDGGVMAVDKHGVITQINDQGTQIIGWDESLIGKPIHDLFGTPADWKGVMLDGSGYTDREIFIKAPRRTVHLLVTAKSICDSNGRIQGVIVIFHEITRIRKLVNEMAGSQARFTFEDILGTSPGIQATKKQAMLAAAGLSSVLLLGETGTGKELFAQAIHNQSERRGHPFVAINCGAIPRELLESELFGYTEGAFTGARKGGRPGKLELASGGTVFLDEIGDMPFDMQVKLLRVLQTGEVNRIGQHKSITADLRIIAATHFDLKQEVAKGNFREDLFYRLNVLPIRIPPLRERNADIIPLARYTLHRCSQVLKKPNIGLSADAEQALHRYHWPGNVRELENVIERAVNLVDGEIIAPKLFGAWAENHPHGTPTATRQNGKRLADVEKVAIEEVLEDVHYNLSRASKELGISRATLYNKIKKYHLTTHRDTV
jgi:sigma-54 dependent transcriptional regulator, acetoin dehydrogenase operon transcriptional activator AcoR